MSLRCLVAVALGAVIGACCGKAVILSEHGSLRGAPGTSTSGPHGGVDFRAEVGELVLAAADGVVLRVDSSDGAGRSVVIAHPGFGRATYYVHLRAVSVSPGAQVRRGEVIGEVGHFARSGDVPHVHLELCRGSCSDADRVDTEDPLAGSAGCFERGKSYPSGRLALTFPVPCISRWWTPRPKTGRAALDQVYLYAEATSGFLDSLGLGSRALLQHGAEKELNYHLGWDTHGSYTLDGDLCYDATLLAGFGPRNKGLTIGLLGGVGASRIAGGAPTALELPVELFAMFNRDNIHAQLWFRTSWIFGDESRRGGGEYAMSGADEITVGLGVRLPPRSKYGLFVGATYREALDGRAVALSVGTSLDSLLAPLRGQ